MRIKNALISILLLIYLPIHSQIKIDDVGDGWKGKVESALVLIEKTDQSAYNDVIKYCNHISFWTGNHSTTQYPKSIIISTKDMKINSINNLACLIVHESQHLKINAKSIILTEEEEELYCYRYEYEFAKKIINIEDWLINHISSNIKKLEFKINDRIRK
jgi:hypothetical protein